MTFDLFGGVTPQETKPQQSRRIRMQERNADGSWKINPMIKLYGEMPGKKCKTCIHLFYRQFSKKYYKCELREGRCSRGPSSDHRVNFPACGKHEEETTPNKQ
jgi:hypothetical protein